PTVPESTGVLVKLGGLFSPGTAPSSSTVITKACEPTAPVASAASITTSWSPTSSTVGVPASNAVPSPLSVSASHAGSTDALIVSASPSGSVATISYSYGTSGDTLVTGVLVRVGMPASVTETV